MIILREWLGGSATMDLNTFDGWTEFRDYVVGEEETALLYIERFYNEDEIYWDGNDDWTCNERWSVMDNTAFVNPDPHVEDEDGEVVGEIYVPPLEPHSILALENGWSLKFGLNGGFIAILDTDKNEIAYYDKQEWTDDPQVLSLIFTSATEGMLL